MIAALALSAPSFAHGGEDHHEARPDVSPDEQAAWDAAKPVFEKYCFECHSTRTGNERKRALDHLDMDTYPFGGHHAAEAGPMIREVLGADGTAATMPSDDPGVVQGDELATVLAWADRFEQDHPAEHHDGPDPAILMWPLPRQTMVPGRPATPGAVHLMVNAYGHLENVGVPGVTIANGGDRYDGGATHPLLTGDWAMGYWRHERGWLEALLMLDFEPLTVGPGGYPELGQSGEGLYDAQHSHLLVHQAMIAFHPLSGTRLGETRPGLDPRSDLALFVGQGSATVGPAVYMHRGSAPGPLPPRKHHKGENPHETLPVLGASYRYKVVTVEGSWFNADELGPEDDRLRPHLGTPDSFAGRVRAEVPGLAEVQVSAARLRDQGGGEPDATQASASVTLWHDLGSWRVDGLVDYAVDVPDGGRPAHGVLGEVALRDPGFRNTYWGRAELNEREEEDGTVSTPWTFETLGIEHVFVGGARSGVQLGAFAETTLTQIPAGLASRYGRRNAVSLDVGVHLSGMWMLDRSGRATHHHGH